MTTISQPAGTDSQACLEKLNVLRAAGGDIRTHGLSDAVLEDFLGRDETLGQAIEEAWEVYEALSAEMPELLAADEIEQAAVVREGIVNFYPEDALNPYVPLAARGPWIVTTKGAVVHDSGGYGMLGLGHNPEPVLEALARHQVMANVMTPHVSQLRLVGALRREIGRSRDGGCPFHSFLFMNSGSEAVSVAARIADVNAKLMTDPGGRHAGKPIQRLALRGGFHGRTLRPAQFSDSTLAVYKTHMATFRDGEDVLTIEPNDVEALKAMFAKVEAEGVFVEAFFMEPVMGEGNPGLAVTPEFYDVARELTTRHGTLLLMDSIQAGLRAHGCLSIVDYPGFEHSEAPDLETYSKALNAGQYPLSVLAMTESAAALYRKGIYGNTMTAAPRALDIGLATLESITPEIRENIRARGEEFLTLLEALAAEMGDRITTVLGTGLLVQCGLNPKRYKAYGQGSTEEYLRTQGIGVIHGGKNALRFTPHFRVTSEELKLIVDAIRDALLHGPTIG